MDAGGKGSEVLDGTNGKKIVSKSLIRIPYPEILDLATLFISRIDRKSN